MLSKPEGIRRGVQAAARPVSAFFGRGGGTDASHADRGHAPGRRMLGGCHGTKRKLRHQLLGIFAAPWDFFRMVVYESRFGTERPGNERWGVIFEQ